MRTTLESRQNQINLSAIVLDRRVPNWHNQINVDVLDLQFRDKCVSGQLGINDWRNPDLDIDWIRRVDGVTMEYSYSMGFHIPTGTYVGTHSYETAMSKMTEFWKYEIDSRRISEQMVGLS